MATVRSALQMPGALGESLVFARATFLDAILRFKRHVITDLWDTALEDCKLAVFERFYCEIFAGIDLKEFHREKDKQFIESPRTCGDYFVRLLQQKLSPQFSDLATPPDPVRHEFFSFHVLSKATTVEASKLARAITAWSQKWNLDAEWCRDHALKVLLAWLFNRDLPWVGVFRSRLWPVQHEGWRLNVSNLTSDGDFSRVLIEFDIEAMGTPPEPFSFAPGSDLPNFTFQAQWNIATDSEAQFKKRARLDFRLALLETEATRLKRLKGEGDLEQMAVKELESQLASKKYGKAIDKKFNEQLVKYISSMKAWKAKAKTENSLVEITHGPRDEHVRWFALYQIPDENGDYVSQDDFVDFARESVKLALPGALPLYFQITWQIGIARTLLFPRFADARDLKTDSLRKILYRTAKLLDLKPRNPRVNAGRRRGSEKKADK